MHSTDSALGAGHISAAQLDYISMLQQLTILSTDLVNTVILTCAELFIVLSRYCFEPLVLTCIFYDSPAFAYRDDRHHGLLLVQVHLDIGSRGG